MLYLLSCDGWELWVLGTAVLFHELGHLAALRVCGVRFRGLSLGEAGPLIGCGALSTSREEVLTALSGPLAGLLWALLASALPIVHREEAAAVSLLMSLFNLLPIPESDGGRIFLALGGSAVLLRRCGAVILSVLTLLCLRRRLWYSAAVALRLLYGCRAGR